MEYPVEELWAVGFKEGIWIAFKVVSAEVREKRSGEEQGERRRKRIPSRF